MEYCGEVVNNNEFQRRTQEYHDDGISHFYFMTLKQNEIVDATRKGSKSRFINHSCDPNCETQKVCFCFFFCFFTSKIRMRSRY